MGKIGRSSILAAVLTLLTACGGANNIGTGTATTPTTPGTPTCPAGQTLNVDTGACAATPTTNGPTVTTLRLRVSSNSLPSDADTTAEGVTLTALATDRNNNAVAGASISFVATSGAVIVTNAVTDAGGSATAVLTTGGDPTLRTITVRATQGSLTGGPLDVQVVAPTSPAVPAPALGSGLGSSYVDQVIALGQTSISAGGSSSLHLDLVDRNNGNAALTSQTPSVSFSSPCISQGRATVNGPAAVSGGALDATYVASGCSGSDKITATATLANGSQLTATGTLTVQPAALGSIRFDSVTPSTIGLKGSGQQETAVVRFQVLDASGGPATAGSTVSFRLDTSVGGITFTPTSAQTNAQGFVQTVVNSGTVATAVRVTASTVGSSGQAITTQSERLVISTAIPDQNSFSLSGDRLQIEGKTLDGNETKISINAADRFNNPVPDGTAISFTTECGSVEPSCTTVKGTCSVQFRTQDPRSDADNRCTVLATAIGEESYSDSNGNGRFDSGEPFTDLGEAFVDKNENGARNATNAVATNEEFADFNSDGTFQSNGSGNFTGTLCGTGCDTATSLNVRKSLTIIMGSSSALISVSPSSIVLPSTGSTSVTVRVTDDKGNCMATGTTIEAQTSYGSVTGVSQFTQANSPGMVCESYQFNLKGPGDASPAGQFTVTVTTPTTRTVSISNTPVGPTPGP